MKEHVQVKVRFGTVARPATWLTVALDQGYCPHGQYHGTCYRHDELHKCNIGIATLTELLGRETRGIPMFAAHGLLDLRVDNPLEIFFVLIVVFTFSGTDLVLVLIVVLTAFPVGHSPSGDHFALEGQYRNSVTCTFTRS